MHVPQNLCNNLILTFKWIRIIGDTLFASGTVALTWFIFGLKGGWSFKKK